MTEMRKTMPATLDAVEPFFVEFRSLCGFLERASDRFAAELLLREALTNAVRHGSRGAPASQVRCAVRLSRRQLTIAVEDDGEGFDWRRAGRDDAEDLLSSGRGLEILRKYATRIRFNQKGNSATILKRFGKAKKQ